MKIAKKIMTRLTMILLIGGSLFNAGCNKTDYHQLSEADLTWLVYENNEVDVFSNGTATATYAVSIRTKSYTQNSDDYNEFTGASFNHMYDTTAVHPDDSKGGLLLEKQNDESLLVTLTWPHFPEKDIPINNIPFITATINGLNYSDIIYIDLSAITDSRFYIGKLWYSKSEGMMQYEDMFGDTWVKL